MLFSFLSGQPGPGEIILIFVVILVLFGPRRLPEIAKMIGKTLTHLRNASHDFKDQIMKMEEPPPIDVSSVETTEPEEGPEEDISEGEDGYDIYEESSEEKSGAEDEENGSSEQRS